MTRHLVRLGDAVFDDQAYVPPGRAVIDHVRAGLAAGARATLLVVDGGRKIARALLDWSPS